MEIPCILLVEDDPTSRRFLELALAGLPATVDAVDCLANALRAARRRRHDAWVFDARLPDGSGTSLLGRLRADGFSTPALAHTASHDPCDLQALRDAGFARVLCKPIAAEALRDAIHGLLGAGERQAAPAPAEGTGSGTGPIWDDDAALRALGGDPGHVARLRSLFLEDLAKSAAELDTQWHRNATASLAAALHRLRAGCGYVGASRLSDAVVAWQAAPGDDRAHDRFRRAVRETLDQPPPASTPP